MEFGNSIFQILIRAVLIYGQPLIDAFMQLILERISLIDALTVTAQAFYFLNKENLVWLVVWFDVNVADVNYKG